MLILMSFSFKMFHIMPLLNYITSLFTDNNNPKRTCNRSFAVSIMSMMCLSLCLYVIKDNSNLGVLENIDKICVAINKEV